ncbi:MAG: DUF3159 domain-containing protein [Actinomycetaceae bacterium]|nr:DUF3159 domain-containing protein [Actinomycetaceae bacterium]
MKNLPGITAQGNFSLQEAFGGVRGLVESVLPGLLFVVVYVVTFRIDYSVYAAGAVSLLALVMALAQKQSVKQSSIGLLGVAIGVAWALWSGQARNFFAFGLYINTFYFALLLLSVIFKNPVVGWLLATIVGKPKWREDAVFYHATLVATWLWVGMFALRLVIEVPLYLANMVTALGSMRLLLGLPPYILCAYLTWLCLRPLGLKR